MKSKKRHITLIELLIVLAIMLLFAGLIGINISKASKEQRFKDETQQILNQLRMAQEFMVIFQVNVSLLLEHQHQGWTYQLVFDTPPPPQIAHLAKDKPSQLSEIKQIEFEDLNHFDAKDPKDKIYIRFLANGTRMSRGLLQLANHRDNERYIDLPGYVTPLKLTLSKPSKDNTVEEERNFNLQLLQRTIEEVRVQE